MDPIGRTLNDNDDDDDDNDDNEVMMIHPQTLIPKDVRNVLGCPVSLKLSREWKRGWIQAVHFAMNHKGCIQAQHLVQFADREERWISLVQWIADKKLRWEHTDTSKEGEGPWYTDNRTTTKQPIITPEKPKRRAKRTRTESDMDVSLRLGQTSLASRLESDMENSPFKHDDESDHKPPEAISSTITKEEPLLVVVPVQSATLPKQKELLQPDALDLGKEEDEDASSSYEHFGKFKDESSVHSDKGTVQEEESEMSDDECAEKQQSEQNLQNRSDVLHSPRPRRAAAVSFQGYGGASGENDVDTGFSDSDETLADTDDDYIDDDDDDDASSVDSDESTVEDVTDAQQQTQRPRHVPQIREKDCEWPNWLDDFENYLRHIHRTKGKRMSPENIFRTMKQVRVLVSGAGITYEPYWNGKHFLKGEKVDLDMNLVCLRKDAIAFAAKYGRDKGNGWMMMHPLRKLQNYKEYLAKKKDGKQCKRENDPLSHGAQYDDGAGEEHHGT